MLVSRVAWFLLLVFMAGMLAVSCSGPAPSPTAPRNTATLVRSTATLTPLPTPGPDTVYTEKVNLDLIGPPGPGRDLVIMNCDYCHSWVCTVRGQRTLDHWVEVEDVHRENGWLTLTDKDWSTLFGYLETNFNDKKPELTLPDIFKLAGCTYSPLR